MLILTDYGMGDPYSVANIISHVGEVCCITLDVGEIAAEERFPSPAWGGCNTAHTK
jgi:imidazoleglycerol phosphate synthase glutamine amidotransferase subunit HisH